MIAVDLFAGTGWGVALQRLGINERGVENMPEAIATRELNGMTNWLADVWDVLETAPVDSPEFQAAILIASPPCQTFSMAGNGAGRKALDTIDRLIDERAYLRVADLRAFGETHDPKTALMLTPLAYIVRHLPRYVVLEQVPTVLPVWQRYAVEMRKWGYSVAVEILNAEQYGVPQTRRRAILVAKRDPEIDGEARMPTPTHSRYYTRNPTKLDPDVAKWISMAEALGWGVTDRPYLTISSGTEAGGGTDPAALGGAGARRAVERERERGAWLVSNYSTESASGGIEIEGNASKRSVRSTDAPALTVTANADRNKWLVANDKLAHSARRSIDEPAPTITGGHDHENRVWVGNQKPEGGQTPSGYQERDDDKPAPTVTAQSRSARWKFAGAGRTAVDTAGHQPRDLDEPAHTITAKATAAWVHDRPATTVQGTDRVWPGGHKINADDIERLGEAEASARYGSRAASSGVKVTLQEAQILQSYPADFEFVGNKGKRFLQVGNAVPPLLAEAILRGMLDA